MGGDFSLASGRLRLGQRVDDVVHDAALGVVQQAEVVEGVVEAQHGDLELGDGVVELWERQGHRGGQWGR